MRFSFYSTLSVAGLLATELNAIKIEGENNAVTTNNGYALAEDQEVLGLAQDDVKKMIKEEAKK